MPDNPPFAPILVTGATSPIAEAFATRRARAGYPLMLAGRDLSELTRVAQDLRVRFGATVHVEAYDAASPGAGRALAVKAHEIGVTVAVAFHGRMGEKENLADMMQVNCLSVAELLEAMVHEAQAGSHLVLAAVSSVAGDRGRQSNYPYGSTKAALDAYLSGLRNRAHHLGHRVITVKPGFVRTRMTAGKVNPRSPLLAEPAQVAADIDRALASGSADVVYTPWFWRGIMRVIRAIPEPLFKRMKL